MDKVVGLKISDITKDILMIFSMSYEYDLNFTNMVKLYNISKKYYWTFMEICSPMLKMGIRKAANMKKSVENIMPYLQSRETGVTELTPREDYIMEVFSWFLQDSFTDGEACLHVSQLKTVPFAKGYGDTGMLAAHNYEGIVNNLDRVSYVMLGSDKYYKTSRILYYLEKYCGDLDVREINALPVKTLLKRISEGEERYHEQELESAKLYA